MKKSFILYNDIWYTVKELSLDERGELFTVLLKKMNNIKDDKTISKTVKIALVPILRQIERDQAAYKEKCERYSQNGSAGGRPRK